MVVVSDPDQMSSFSKVGKFIVDKSLISRRQSWEKNKINIENLAIGRDNCKIALYEFRLVETIS